MPKPTFEKSNGWWYFRWRDATGRRVKQPLGKDPRWKGKGHKIANPPPDILLIARKYEDLALQARHGVDVSKASPIPLRPFLESYRETFALGGNSPRSLTELDVAIKQFLVFCEGKGIKTVQAVSSDLCRAFFEARAKAGRKRKTLEKIKSLLSPAFTAAEVEGKIPRNPWRSLSPPGKRRTEESPFWTDEEVDRIAAQLTGWARDLFLVGIHSGFRVTGLVRMKWRDVLWTDPRSPIGSLWCRNAKGDKPYRVPLFPKLREVLERRKETVGPARPDDWIFPGRGGNPITRDSVDYQIEQAMRRAGVEDKGRRCHAMRETFATRCGRSGVHPRTLMQWMNHTDIKQSMKYMHYDISAETSEVAKLDR